MTSGKINDIWEQLIPEKISDLYNDCLPTKQEVGSKIDLSVDEENFKLTATLSNSDNQILSESEVDIPTKEFSVREITENKFGDFVEGFQKSAKYDIVIPDVDGALCNPCISVIDGVVYCQICSEKYVYPQHVYFIKSTDNGKTWQKFHEEGLDANVVSHEFVKCNDKLYTLSVEPYESTYFMWANLNDLTTWHKQSPSDSKDKIISNLINFGDLGISFAASNEDEPYNIIRVYYTSDEGEMEFFSFEMENTTSPLIEINSDNIFLLTYYTDSNNRWHAFYFDQYGGFNWQLTLFVTNQPIPPSTQFKNADSNSSDITSDMQEVFGVKKFKDKFYLLGKDWFGTIRLFVRDNLVEDYYSTLVWNEVTSFNVFQSHSYVYVNFLATDDVLVIFAAPQKTMEDTADSKWSNADMWDILAWSTDGISFESIQTSQSSEEFYTNGAYDKNQHLLFVSDTYHLPYEDRHYITIFSDHFKRNDPKKELFYGKEAVNGKFAEGLKDVFLIKPKNPNINDMLQFDGNDWVTVNGSGGSIKDIKVNNESVIYDSVAQISVPQLNLDLANHRLCFVPVGVYPEIVPSLESLEKEGYSYTISNQDGGNG